MTPEEIRKNKGKSFVGVTTCFICHDGAGKILFGKRSSKARDEQESWDFGGGGLKWGVTAEDNVRREIKEEYNLEAQDIQFLGYRDVFRVQKGVNTHWLALDFVVKVDPLQARINEPELTTEFGWFKLDKPPSSLHSQIAATLSKYDKQLRAILVS